MATKTEVMKKIKELQNERRILLKSKKDIKDKTRLKEVDAKVKEIDKIWKALIKDYEAAIDDEPSTYAKPT